jgi:hypothetical protein
MQWEKVTPPLVRAGEVHSSTRKRRQSLVRLILLEKVTPAGQRMGQAAGALLVAGGVVLLGLALWGGMQPEMHPGTESGPGMEEPGMGSM